MSESALHNCREAEIVEIMRNKITSVPVGFLTNKLNLQIFRLLSNNITQPLPVGLFDNLPSLSNFCHEHNPTGKLYQEIFRGLESLTILHINNISLTQLPDCIFRPLVNLQWLAGNDNRLTILHQKSFRYYSNVLGIQFDNNYIEAIDRRILENAPNMTRIYLENNICADFNVLDLNSNRSHYMDALEPCFAEYDRRFPNTCNFITHELYGYTCELINFDASVPIINNVVDCFGEPDVTGVIFTESKIDKIPPFIFDIFPQLKFVQAINVGLETALIENCGENLEFIDVSQNLIKSLPSNAFECENIQTINVDENCISSIQSCERSFVENLTKLKKLSMKKTLCVDKEFEVDKVGIEEIEKEMKRCFKMWYVM